MFFHRIIPDVLSLKISVLCAQSHLTLCHPTDRSPPGSPVHGILQARILEWVAVSSLKISEIWLIIPLSYAHHCVTTGQHRSLDYFSLLFAALSVSQQKTGGAPKLGEIQVLLFTKRLLIKTVRNINVIV